MRPRIPWLALVLVRLRAGARAAEIEADLRELFDARASEHGARYARRKYWHDAASLWLHRRPPVASGVSWTTPPASGFSRTRLADTTWHDIVFTARLFRRQPGTMALGVAGLALAIGLATSVFSILNAGFIRPLGVEDPDSAVHVWRSWRGGAATSWPYGDYLEAREAARLTILEGSIREAGPMGLNVDEVLAASTPVHLVTGGYFPTFGGRTILGRGLTAEDDRPEPRWWQWSATRSGVTVSTATAPRSAGRSISSASPRRLSASLIGPSRAG